MPEFGAYSERELADKLEKISEKEMQEYYKQRMQKYRYYYIFAVSVGLFSIVSLFLGEILKWIGAGLAIITIVIFSYGTFQRKKWIRVYQNLLYVKKMREKKNKEQEKLQKPHKTKFDKYNI